MKAPPSLAAVVLGLVALGWYTSQVVVINKWLQESPWGLVHTVVLNVSVALLLINYFVSAYTPPGAVPAGWTPPDEPASWIERKRSTGEYRFCSKCEQYKPPRTHHCSQCKTCVLRMDHHCPWIDNCVGARNHKAFLLFLLYAAIALVQTVLLLIFRVFWLIQDRPSRSRREARRTARLDAIEGLSFGFAFSLLIPVALGVVSLLLFHLYLISRNTTTIEYYEFERYEADAQRKGLHFRNPYDFGLFRNFALFCGPPLACALCPVGPPPQHGLSFPVVPGTQSRLGGGDGSGDSDNGDGDHHEHEDDGPGLEGRPDVRRR